MRHFVMLGLFAAAVLAGCGGGGGSSPSSPTTSSTTNTGSSGTTPTSAPTQVAVATATPTAAPTATATAANFAQAYQSAQWQSTYVTVTFTGSCSMKMVTTGIPINHNSYYLAPANAGQTVVATTPVSGMSMAVSPYSTPSNSGQTNTFNTCPTKASVTTATGKGPIGYTISGEAIYNPYEATNTVALTDNASYTFTVNGTSQTAYFIDQCNNHPTQTSTGATEWHFHGVPTCLTATIDGASGPSHIIGIALDGYPIYGGRDINGNVISTSQLDSCNGITSPTPEFPNGVYHYVLPIGVTTVQSSLSCYTGVVAAGAMLAMGEMVYCGLDDIDRETRDKFIALVKRNTEILKKGDFTLRT